MKTLCRVFLLCLLPPVHIFAQGAPATAPRDVPKLVLKDGWAIQSSADVKETGEVVSTAKFQPKNWHPAVVPATVVAAQVREGVYPDPFYGMNLRSIPGTSYNIGANFSNVAMSKDSPFAVPWWYRTEFSIPSGYKGKTIWLKFNGINYRADIWLNGRQIAQRDQVAGAWRTYEFNVTDAARIGGVNVLAAEIWAPTENDLAITFVDWNPQPPDKNMGLWRDVEINATGPVALRSPAVASKVNSPANDRASLTVCALLKNASNESVKGRLRCRIDKIDISQDVALGPGESKDVAFDPEGYPALNIVNPRLWWPAQMGQPNLYNLIMEFDVNGSVSDRAATQFGIREVTSELDANKHRVFSVNGKRILVRGGGWAMDMLLRQDTRRLEDELLYVSDMGLNTVRLEGKLEVDAFFDIADRMGILVMAGWCCCDHWEHWPKWIPMDHKIAEESLRSQMYRLRSHPSLLMWLNGSDNPPPPDVEKMYLEVERQCRWPNPIVSSATAKPTTITGESGVKMTGPYDYVAPSYWLKDTKHGGAYGFNTETSPGPAVPPVESLRQMLPSDHLWPIDDWWNYHAGSGNFKNVQIFTEALNARYGAASDVNDFAMKSQVMAYEGIRAMFEAYSRNKYTSTGVIQWMLNNGWPSLIWHLYDFYLRPGGGYFGAKKACEPLHPLYSYDDNSVWVVSSQYRDAKGLRLTAKVFNLDMTEKFSKEIVLDAPADSSQRVFVIPEIPGLSSTYFVELWLDGPGVMAPTTNTYWLSSKPEVLALDKSTWFVTPTASYADFTALRQLPKVALKVSSTTEHNGPDVSTHVTIENPDRSIAFFIRLKVNRGVGGPEVLPVLWQDNYFSLLPGEKRQVTARYRATDLGPASPAVEVRGWNVGK